MSVSTDSTRLFSPSGMASRVVTGWRLLDCATGNTVEWMDNRELITTAYLDPISRHVRSLSPLLTTFAAPAIYFSRLHGPPTPMTPTQLGSFWDQIFTGAPALSFIAPKDGMGENQNNRSLVTAYYRVLRDVSRRHGRPFWSDVELFQGEFTPPPERCAYSTIRPASLARIVGQLRLEATLADTLTAWEWHAFMSPLADQCAWHGEARELYRGYLRYVHNGTIGAGRGLSP